MKRSLRSRVGASLLKGLKRVRLYKPPRMKFRPDSDEEACSDIIPGSDKGRWAGMGGIACLRRFGHPGEHIGMQADAAKADGVCRHCRSLLEEDHRPDCYLGESTEICNKFFEMFPEWDGIEWTGDEMTIYKKDSLEPYTLYEFRPGSPIREEMEAMEVLFAGWIWFTRRKQS